MPRRSAIPIAAAALLVLAATVVGAETPETPPLYLTFAVQDYRSLYPEADYGNPAVILQLDRPVLLNGALFTGDGYSSLETHTIDYAGLGAADGTSASTWHTSTNRVGIDGFFPINASLATGFGAMVDLGFERSATEDTDWIADPETTTSERTDNTQAWYGAGYFAYRLGDLDLGARLGFAGSHDPWSLTWNTTTLLPGGTIPYATGFADPDRIFIWNPQLDLGGIYRLKDVTLGLTASLAWTGSRTTPYVTVDKDANGLDEAVVTEEEYQTSTAAWANGPHPEYAWKDQSDEWVVALSPSVIWQVAPKLAVLATGSVHAYDRTTVVQYEHLDSTDLSVARLDVRHPFVALTAGVALAPSSAVHLRTGIGYLMSGVHQIDNSLDAAGASPYDPANTSHYPEVNWGAEPNNTRVENSVNPDTDTFQSVTHAVRGLASIEYQPAATVLLFGGAALGYGATIDTYRVYNTADDTIWEEKVTTGSFSLDYALLLGVGIHVSATTFVGVRTGSGSVGALTLWDELPTSGGTASTGGQGPYRELVGPDRSGSWTIDLFCVVGL